MVLVNIHNDQETNKYFKYNDFPIKYITKNSKNMQIGMNKYNNTLCCINAFDA